MKGFKIIYSLINSIYKDRYLLANLSLQDFKRRFAGSYLGALWGVLNPLLTMTVYWMVFEFGFRSGDADGFPFLLWFASGICVWLFFSEGFSLASNSFLDYSYLVKKVVFNINILPLVKIFSSMLTHFFFVVLVAILCVVFGYYPSIYWIQLPYYMVCTICLLFGISLCFASVMVFFRDLSQIISIILLIGMWGTPIAWNISMFPEKVQLILKANPMFYLVQGYRDCFLYQTWFWEHGRLTLYFWCVVLGMALLGGFIYNKLKSSFADFL